MSYTREEIVQLRKENNRWPERLKEIPKSEWPPIPQESRIRLRVLRSRKFLVIVARERPGVLWLSINRTDVKGSRWVDGITWDELQQIKNECGYGNMDAIEIYPRDEDVVNVANIRHLFVLEDALVEFGWRKNK